MTDHPQNQTSGNQMEITPLGVLSIFILGMCVGISLMYLYAKARYDNPGWQSRSDQQVELK